MTKYDYCEMFGGAVRVKQYLDGYRFSIDSVLLAWWPHLSPDDVVADIGTGCGIVSIILTVARGACNVTAFELQPELASLAAENARANWLDDRITVVEGDVREIAGDYVGAFDLAVANPPFRELGSGRVSTGAQKAVARHELELTLAKLARAAKTMLKPGGRFCLIYPTRRTAELLAELPAAGLATARLRFVHPRAGEPANLVLVEAQAARPGELTVEPPLYVYDGEEYSAEVSAMYEPSGLGP